MVPIVAAMLVPPMGMKLAELRDERMVVKMENYLVDW